MLTYEHMIRIRDNIIAQKQSIHFQSEMCHFIFNRYPHFWKYGLKLSNDMTLKYDRSRRKWLGLHKDNLLKPIVFDKKPTKNQIVLQTLWKVSKEVSKSNPNFLTIL